MIFHACLLADAKRGQGQIPLNFEMTSQSIPVNTISICHNFYDFDNESDFLRMRKGTRSPVEVNRAVLIILWISQRKSP